jgi:hypothetical protein
MQDDTGRWSHWSAPVEFTTTAPGNADAQMQFLRISELMYNPPDANAAETAAGFSTQDFEFVEFVNTSPVLLDLTGVRFSDGVEFDFTDSAVTSLGPGQHVLVVRSAAAVAMRYGAGLPVAGEFAGDTGLNNTSETIAFDDSAGRTVVDFTYDQQWHRETDGRGFSLVVIDTDGEYDGAANWRSSALVGGSPGAPDAEALPADFTGDGVVNRHDAAIVLRNLGTPTGADRSTGDADRNGAVDLIDLALAQSSFGDTLFGSPAASASPAASIALAEDVAGRRTARPLRREFRRNAVQVNRRSPLDSTPIPFQVSNRTTRPRNISVASARFGAVPNCDGR